MTYLISLAVYQEYELSNSTISVLSAPTPAPVLPSTSLPLPTASSPLPVRLLSTPPCSLTFTQLSNSAVLLLAVIVFWEVERERDFSLVGVSGENSIRLDSGTALAATPPHPLSP